MKYKNKKQKKTMLLLLILLGVTVGFALLSTTLKINGTAGIKKNTWDIHWENVVPNVESTVESPTPVIDTAKTTVSYEVELSLPGDFYEFTVDAKNDGSINGVIDDIRHTVKQVTVVDEEEVEEEVTLPEYILYSIVYDGTTTKPTKGDILEAGEKQTYRVRIEYDSQSEILPSTNLTYKITDEIDYQQTKESKEIAGFVIDGSTEPKLGGLKFGDEICIKDECFNVLSTNETTTTLLAKYNLLVGDICTDENTCTPIPTNTEGYGKQSASAVGGSFPVTYPTTGVLKFADSNYWLGKVGTGPEYEYQGTVSRTGTTNGTTPGIVEDYDPIPYVVDSNSYVYTPLVNYLSYLKSIGANSETTIKLVNPNELYSISNEAYQAGLDDNFLFTSAYWGGYATNAYSDMEGEKINGSVLAVYHGYGGWGGSGVTNNVQYGVRPVIEVPTSSIVYNGWKFVNPTETTATSQQWEYWEKGKKIQEGLKYLDGSYDGLNIGMKYYLFHNGYMYMGWYEENGNRYFFNNEAGAKGYARGYRLEDTTKTIAGVEYVFDSNGVCTQNCNQAQNVYVKE